MTLLCQGSEITSLSQNRLGGIEDDVTVPATNSMEALGIDIAVA